MEPSENSRKYSAVIARCWADDAFKQKLLADPAGAMAQAGVDIPAGLTLRAVENTDKVMHFVIPAKPTDLSDDDLAKIAGGGNCFPFIPSVC